VLWFLLLQWLQLLCKDEATDRSSRVCWYEFYEAAVVLL
jgi:hypothetical protein